MAVLRTIVLSSAMFAFIGCGEMFPVTPIATTLPSATPRTSAAPSRTTQASPSVTPGLTRDQAVAVALQIPEVAQRNQWLLSARLEHWGDDYHYPDTSPAPEPSRLVWVIDLAYQEPGPTGGAGWYVVLDYKTGEILSSSEWVG